MVCCYDSVGLPLGGLWEPEGRVVLAAQLQATNDSTVITEEGMEKIGVRKPCAWRR